VWSAGDIGRRPGTEGGGPERACWRGHPGTAKARAPSKSATLKGTMATALRDRVNRQTQQTESQSEGSKS